MEDRMNEELFTAIRDLAKQTGANDAEFIAAMSPEMVLDLVYEIERRFAIQAELSALRTRTNQLISETCKYAAEISLGKSATIKLSMALDEVQAQSDRRASLLRQYHLGHKTPALIEAVEKELK
jgi:hypothetical protein